MDSIQQFTKNIIPKIYGAIDRYITDPDKEMDMEDDIRTLYNRFVCSLIGERLEAADKAIYDSHERKERYYPVRKDSRTITSSFGDIKFDRTLYRDKTTGKNSYLLDRHMCWTPHVKHTDGVTERILKEVASSSYEKSGKILPCDVDLSKNTVKNIVHTLEFPKREYIQEKREVKVLYIEADEDHCSLQPAHKGEVFEVGKNGRKINGEIAKLVYVHEGLEEPRMTKKGTPEKRRRLKNIHYFSGLYKGEENKEFWKEISDYITNTYDVDKLEQVYLMSDGGAWITEGKGIFRQQIYLLDEFHLEKYIMKMVRHMKDSDQDAAGELRKTIRRGTKEDFVELTDNLMSYTDDESVQKRISDASDYILKNWTAAKARLTNKGTVVGCSAEGHVSHLLSDRLSSRPMGWSRTGLDKMAHLRAYWRNGYDIKELVRYQKQELSKAAGAEDIGFSAAEVISADRNRNGIIGKYSDWLETDVSDSVRKMLYIQHKIVLI